MSKKYPVKPAEPPAAVPASPADVTPAGNPAKPPVHPLFTVGWALLILSVLVGLGTYGREDKTALAYIGAGAALSVCLVVIGALLGRRGHRGEVPGR